MSPKGKKVVNHPKTYHVLIDCKMCHWEQLHFCKLTQPKARFRLAEDGVFEILLYSCKLETLWAAAQTHSQWICYFPKL